MIYKTFEQADVVSGRSVKVSTGYFDGTLSQEQNTFASSSTQNIISGSNKYDVYNGYYYTDVFSTATQANQTAATHIFSIAYGNVSGYGTSYDEYTNVKAHPTRAIWQQYVNELNDGESFSVKAQSGTTISTISLSTDFVAISFDAQKFKDGMDPGQFQMTLSSSLGHWNVIDDSSITNQSGSDAYNLILGQINTDGTISYWKYNDAGHGGTNGGLTSVQNYNGTTADAQYYPTTGIGLFYPKSGTVIFNVGFLNTINSAISGTWRNNAPSSGDPDIRVKGIVYDMIVKSTDSMRIRYSEYVPSRHYFVRVKNREFNYTNNTTFSYQTPTTDSGGNFHQKGDIIQTDFLTDPKVYVTSVGLYNSNNELVAVAKLSNPALKTFTNELLFKVRLDF